MHCCMLSDSVNVMHYTNATVFALIASDIVAAFRAHLLRKHRNVFRHALESHHSVT
jgi:hypothetical protein